MLLGAVLPSSPAASVVVVLLATAVIWIGSGWFEESAEHLAAHYGLPAVVQGSVVVAVGSSLPELASVVFAGLAGTFGMGIGAIVGSAIFNVLVIPAVSALAAADDALEASRTIVYKEAQFYMLAVSAVVVTFALAVIYVPVPGESALVGRLTRPLAAIPFVLYGLYLFIQWQDVADYDAGPPPAGIDLVGEWRSLLLGLLLILVAVDGLVLAVESLGETLGVPPFLGGVTVVAAATSLPDALVSVRAARSERSTTSLANVFGSNTFDLLVAIPVGVFIVGAVSVDFAVAAPMLGVLTLATVLLFTVLRTDLTLTRIESYALLATYALFVAWVLAETVGVTTLLAGR
jgi:cation:H+ antiporter